MNYLVSITSQGQISIPKKLLNQYNFGNVQKAIVRAGDAGRIIVEPVADFLSLKGVIKTKKKFSAKKIREQFEKHLATRHLI
ncbi:hypothetical protein HY030_00790 [Candidatus Gottesmanbacteria bacterium]|nr:hypothetical protein [Candidatus Gottesmanbacteria bacterium]